MDPKKCTVAQFKKLTKRHEGLAKKDRVYVYAAFEIKTGTLIGAVDIFVMCRDQYQMGNLGYQIHNCYWGKGFGSEAAKAGLKIGFSQLKLNRLEASINLDNKGSVALAKSIRMRSEGIKRGYLFENKRWVDHYVFVANPKDVGLKPCKPLKM